MTGNQWSRIQFRTASSFDELGMVVRSQASRFLRGQGDDSYGRHTLYRPAEEEIRQYYEKD